MNRPIFFNIAFRNGITSDLALIIRWLSVASCQLSAEQLTTNKLPVVRRTTDLKPGFSVAIRSFSWEIRDYFTAET
jgi:hypothetical protein